jgi:hypothetical protein
MYRNVCMLYIQYLHILQFRMSASGIIVHFMGKYTALNGSSVFDLRDFFQERNPGV